MLSTALKGVGGCLLVLGAASMDSPSLMCPVVIALVGCVLMVIGMREDGMMRRKKNRPR